MNSLIEFLDICAFKYEFGGTSKAIVELKQLVNEMIIGWAETLWATILKTN